MVYRKDRVYNYYNWARGAPFGIADAEPSPSETGALFSRTVTLNANKVTEVFSMDKLSNNEYSYGLTIKVRITESATKEVQDGESCQEKFGFVNTNAILHLWSK